MRVRAIHVLVLVAATAVAACAPSTQPVPSTAPQQRGESATQPSRTLVAAVRVEPYTVAARALRTARGVALDLSSKMFNAEMALLNDGGRPMPHLTEALPQLNTDSWRVFPDARMETTYKLRPNLTWHDGTPLAAQDWVFGWQVYGSPDWAARQLPFRTIEEVSAADDRTVVMRWKQLYPEAGSLTGRESEFPALPRHILEQSFQESDPDTFMGHPYWTREYVGLGPYRMGSWEPASFFEGEAFDGYVLGRPKIDRIKVLFISDSNTAMANMLAGEVHLAGDAGVRISQALDIKTDWEPRNAGSALFHPRTWRAVHFQHRPEYQSTRALLDPRVRKALAHTIDKDGINEAVYGGGASPADNMVSPVSRWGAAAQRGSVSYAVDLRRSQQLMEEAGFAKGPDGMYTSPTQGRLAAEVKTNAASDNEAELSILADTFRRAGFDVREMVLAAAQAQDNEVRSTFPNMYSNSIGQGESALLNHESRRIPGPNNRWSGGNRGGWSNPEYDRLLEAFGTTLEPEKREDLVTRMVRIHTDDAGTLSMLYRTQPWVFASPLKGISKVVAPESYVPWNIHEWEFR